MFYIQTSNPQVLICTEVVPSIRNVPSLIFPRRTENAFVFYNSHPLRLDYKYDLGLMIDEIIQMMQALFEDDFSSYECHFNSDGFMYGFDIINKGPKLEVSIVDRFVIGGGLPYNMKHTIHISKEQFLAEWTMLIFKLFNCILKSGISIEDSKFDDFFADLQHKVKSKGVLYCQTR